LKKRKKREIIICNGYSGCRLVFWKDEIAKSDNISECDMLYVKNAYVAGEYGGLSNVYIDFDIHACIAPPPIHSECFFKSSRSKIRSQLFMISSLNGGGRGQFSQLFFNPALSQRVSQSSLSSSDRDRYQQLIFHSLFELSNHPVVCRSKRVFRKSIYDLKA